MVGPGRNGDTSGSRGGFQGFVQVLRFNAVELFPDQPDEMGWWPKGGSAPLSLCQVFILLTQRRQIHGPNFGHVPATGRHGGAADDTFLGVSPNSP